jgi:hypothetical protein
MLRGEGQMESLTHPQARPSAAQLDQWVALAVTTFLRAFGIKSGMNSSLARFPGN